MLKTYINTSHSLAVEIYCYLTEGYISAYIGIVVLR